MAAGEEKRTRRKAPVAQAGPSAAKVEADTVGSMVRPRCLEDFIGQAQLRRNLTVFIKAARSRNEPLDHCLLYGPPGLGKTTLSQIIAAELGVRFKSTSGPALTRAGDLASILASLRERDVLFIDEIHRLPPAVEESLYSAMEDYHLPIIYGKGPSAKIMTIPVKPFTLIGATTRFGMLSAPLRDRFGIIMRMDPYDEDELAQIIANAARRLDTDVEPAAAMRIAGRSRGIPRVALRNLKRIRDYLAYAEASVVDVRLVDEAFSRLNIDKYGLLDIDRRLLAAIDDKFDGGPVGLDSLASAISEDPDTVSVVIE
ncbi:MAG TPA: Holliday junction branch migration DNA helicase RuvB, partial [Clostridia bacterium]|nr:Holliday junction branch migration DNA helicase RuvB [Clostridia bacterium]